MAEKVQRKKRRDSSVTVESVASKEKKNIMEQSEIDESYFIGALWNDPYNYYGQYSRTMKGNEFFNDVWEFYFDLGKRMYETGIKDFDSITVFNFVKKIGVEKLFEEYGEMNTIREVVEIVREGSANIEHYYESIKFTYAVSSLVELYGDKVLVPQNKYDYKKLNREQLIRYWQDKINGIALENITNHDAQNALPDPKTFISNLKKNSASMLEFYNSPALNSITQGLARGHVTMFGGFGGTGKTSVSVDKVVLSYIVNRQKAIIILNEEDADSFRTKIILSLLKHMTDGKQKIKRRNMITGHLTPNEEELIHLAIEKWKEFSEGDDSLIKIVYMERYVMDDVEKLVRYWANRGYHNLMIDTHKVSDNAKQDKRWEIFVEDMKTIYRLTRKQGGGLNLRTIVTFQLADSAIHNRFLDYEAIGEGKGAKNEASVVIMFRNVWSDEYEGEKKALVVRGLGRSKFNPHQGEGIIPLEKGTQYYLMFTPKNRFGKSTEGGGSVLVLKPDFETNTFEEIGWTTIGNDKGGR